MRLKAYRVGGEMISHCSSIPVFDQHGHIILDGDILCKHIHISVIIVYLISALTTSLSESGSWTYQRAQHRDTVSSKTAHPPSG